MTDDNSSVSKKIQLDDIARDLGISKSTVSRAISGKGRISPSTRQKVQDYIRLHQYRPNVIARGLANSKTYNICVVLPADGSATEIPFFQNCLMGVCEVAAASDYDVIVTTTENGDIDLLKRIIQNGKVDGVILTRSVVSDRAADYLKKENVSFVVIGSTPDDSIIQIDSDHSAAAEQLTDYLIRGGCRSIGLILGNMEHIVNKSRLDGVRHAVTGKARSPVNTIIKSNVQGRVSIEKATMELLDKVDCILCGDDYICGIALAKLHHLGRDIPKDVRVASLYNSFFLASHIPPVTAVDIDIRELGITAASVLLDLLDGKAVNPKTLLNFEIVLKKSTN